MKSSKQVMHPAGRRQYHSHASSARHVVNVLHIAASEAFDNLIFSLKLKMNDSGSLLSDAPLKVSKFGILNSGSTEA